MTTAEYAQLQTEQAPVLRFPHWVAVRWCAAFLYVVALIAYTAAYGIPVQRELVISWTCGALACASIGRPPREILQLVARLAADRRRARRLRLHPRRRRLDRHRRPQRADDRLRPIRLLRRDADRMAAGAPLRRRRRALVRRRLHAHLHLVLHRPLRRRRRPLGTRPARLPALRQAPRLAGPRRPRHLHPLPRRATLDGRRRGSADQRPADHLQGLGGPRRRHRGDVLPRPGSRQPGRRRSLPALGLRRPRGDLPLAARASGAAAAAAALPAGDGPDPDGDRRALLLRRRCSAGSTPAP